MDDNNKINKEALIDSGLNKVCIITRYKKKF